MRARQKERFRARWWGSERDGGEKILVHQERARGEVALRPAEEIHLGEDALVEHAEGVLQVGDAHGAEAARALVRPLRLEEPRALGVELDPDPVVEVDQAAVQRPGPAVAAVVGAEHSRAGLVVAAQLLAVEAGPRLVAELDALRERGVAAAE